MKIFKIIALTAVCLVLGVMIALQFKSVKVNQVLAQYEKKTYSELIDELLMEKNNNEMLKTRLQELQREVDAFRSDENSDKKYIEDLEKSVLNARMMAGLETVKGSGIILTMEAQGEISIEDRHIEEIVNELKATDVQAISVNDERIVAMSEIRIAGDYIMVNGRQLVPPYTIKAIGEPERIERALNLLGGAVSIFREYHEFKIDIRKEDNIVVPGVREDFLRIDMLSPVAQ
jgi:uncharacterized protein YlxW (UPF0749 family)